MERELLRDLRDRVEERVAAWGVVAERTVETESSVLVFGRRGQQPVVLKVIRSPGDEWRSGEILQAFDGRGVVRVHDSVEGAVLLERLSPGQSLASLALGGADEEATRTLAGVIRRMSPRTAGYAAPPVVEWGRGFERYAASGDTRIPQQLLSEAQQVFSQLGGSQAQARLLHGDLHHYNVLFDAGRGWVAVDPKGVVGEVEYEIGAALRNPYERPELFAEPAIIRRRVDCFVRELDLDASRVLGWAFTQVVLSAIWSVEDGFEMEPGEGQIALAGTLRSLLRGLV